MRLNRHIVDIEPRSRGFPEGQLDQSFRTGFRNKASPGVSSNIGHVDSSVYSNGDPGRVLKLCLQGRSIFLTLNKRACYLNDQTVWSNSLKRKVAHICYPAVSFLINCQ